MLDALCTGRSLDEVTNADKLPSTMEQVINPPKRPQSVAAQCRHRAQQAIWPGFNVETSPRRRRPSAGITRKASGQVSTLKLRPEGGGPVQASPNKQVPTVSTLRLRRGGGGPVPASPKKPVARFQR
jgi:hypothetical protein